MEKLELVNDKVLKELLKFINEGYAHFQVVYDANGSAIDFLFKDVNPSFANMIGLEKKEIIGKTMLQFYPEFNETLIGKFEKIAEDSGAATIESFSEIPNKTFKVRVFSPGKDIVILVLNDISKPKATGASIKKHQLLFENAGDLILHINEQGLILAANKKALNEYGYSLKELTKLNINDLRHPSMRMQYEEQMRNSELSGVTFEGIHVRKDGTTFPVEVTSKTIIDDNKKIRIHIIRDISERKKTEEKILYLANYDSLTGIANRANILNQFDSNIEGARRGGYNIAFMLIDVDKFKGINDTYGHPVGDMILKTTAQRLQSSIRKVDAVGRFGGDEFVIIAPFVKTKFDIEVLISRIFEEFSKPVDLGKYQININASIGVSIYPLNSQDVKTLINQADESMYLAKKDTGCSYRIFDSI